MSAVAEPPRRLTVRAAVLVAIVLVLGTAAAAPVRQYLAQRAEIQRLEQRVEGLAEARDELEAEVGRLLDPEELERLARACLGMVRPGEIPFVVPGQPPPDC